MNPLCDANCLYEASTKVVKSSSFKQKTQHFEMNRLLEVAKLQCKLYDGNYKPTKGKKFTINERGKMRCITSNAVQDKTVSHVLCDEIIMPSMQKFLVYDNGASQQGKGTSFTRKRLEEHLHSYYREYGTNEGYILLMDFSSYYANILHSKCKKVLVHMLPDNMEYATPLIDSILESYEGNKGINIGEQFAQNVGISYAYRIDNYIEIVKGCGRHARYSDDSYVIHKDKQVLEEMLRDIKSMAKSYNIIINNKKTYITKLSSSFEFLQISYRLTNSGKVVKKINPQNIANERKRLKLYKRLLSEGKMSYKEVENNFKSWLYANWKVMSNQQLYNINILYKDLFGKEIKWKKKSKLHWLMEHRLT